MEDFFDALFSIIWILVICTVIAKAKKKGKGESTRSAVKSSFGEMEKQIEKASARHAEGKGMVEIVEDYDPEQEAIARKKSKPGAARPAKSFLRDTSALSETMVEDRQHDWLARQIREERKRVVWNNFVDLGAAHDEACAAEINRMDHKKHHQSYVVDDGVSE